MFDLLMVLLLTYVFGIGLLVAKRVDFLRGHTSDSCGLDFSSLQQELYGSADEDEP